MKKIIAIILVSFYLTLLGLCQQADFLRTYWFGYDNDKIKFLQDSLKTKGYIEFIILHTDHIFTPNDLKEKEDSVYSVIIWHDNKYSYLKILSADNVYKTNRIPDISIFQYQNKLLTGVRMSELKDLKFYPPGTGPNALFYYHNKIELYFEKIYNINESPYIYNPDKNYEKYRNEWFNLVAKFLKDEINSRIFESDYDRYKK